MFGFTEPETGDWPAWVPFFSAGIAALTIAVALIERLARPHPNFEFAVAAGLFALAPFLLDVASRWTNRSITLPIELFPVPVLLGVGYLVFHPAEIDFAPFLLVFLCAEVVSRSRARPAIALPVGAMSIGVMLAADYLGPYDGSFVWVIGIAFGWFGGYMVHNQEVRTEQMRQTQAARADKAVVEERSRIAREVHDVIAHSMSVTMLHITAARMALERGQKSQALEALKEAEGQGRKSMNDIRHTVGLLGPEGNDSARPLPGITDLPQLASDFRSAGVEVTLRIDGNFASLPQAAGLSVYRIVQESLTNAAKHAPGAPAEVTLVIEGEELRLHVHNRDGTTTAKSDGNGIGLKGMMERAAVLGGSIQAGPHGDGWSVFLTAPMPASAE